MSQELVEQHAFKIRIAVSLSSGMCWINIQYHELYMKVLLIKLVKKPIQTPLPAQDQHPQRNY